MEIQSEQNRFKNSLDTEELTYIEFSEQFGSGYNSENNELHELHGGNSNEIEKDFYEIFNNAKEYSKRLENIANPQNSVGSESIRMHGGTELDSLDRLLMSESADYKMSGGNYFDTLDRLLESDSCGRTATDLTYSQTAGTDEEYDYSMRNTDQFGGKGEIMVILAAFGSKIIDDMSDIKVNNDSSVGDIARTEIMGIV